MCRWKHGWTDGWGDTSSTVCHRGRRVPVYCKKLHNMQFEIASCNKDSVVQNPRPPCKGYISTASHHTWTSVHRGSGTTLLPCRLHFHPWTDTCIEVSYAIYSSREKMIWYSHWTGLENIQPTGECQFRYDFEGTACAAWYSWMIQWASLQYNSGTCPLWCEYGEAVADRRETRITLRVPTG